MKIKSLVAVVVIFSFLSSAYANGLVNKKYQEQFISAQAVKNYPAKKVKTAEFLDAQSSFENGLLESFKNTSHYSYEVNDDRFIYGTSGVLNNQAFTYDNAVAVIAYLLCNNQKRASEILEVYKNEFYISKGDYNYGLFNSYRTDREDTGWGLSIGIDGDRMHAGPNLWVAIAALQYTALTGNLEFLPFAIDICKWVDTLPHFKFEDGTRGAASMGSGWGPDWTKVYSTENVLDNYAALNILKKIYLMGNNETKNVFKAQQYSLQTIEKEMANIEKWLMKVIFDNSKKTFNMGYNEEGVDKSDSLDSVSWAICIFGPEKLLKMGIDPYYLMEFADKNFLVTDTIEGKKIQGYDFTNYDGRQKNYKMIWFEGTSFHTVAMQVMADFYQKNKDKKNENYFKDKSVKTLDEIQTASSLCNMEFGALSYTSKKLTDKEYRTSYSQEWEIPRGRDNKWVASVSSTGWFIIALSAFNPLTLDTENVNYKLFKK